MSSQTELDLLQKTISNLEQQVNRLEIDLHAGETRVDSLVDDLDTFWIFLGAVLVFFMQCGFALVEAGSVRSANTKNILLKNVMDACIGALVWWAVGFPFAYGTGGVAPNGFIGGKNFFLGGKIDTSAKTFSAFWLFQWAFSATAATIVSGAVAERCEFVAYILYTSILTAFIYPVVAHWGYSSEGWLSPTRSPPLLGANGFVDFAGSGIVHMCGGAASLMAAYFIGPRYGRFNVDGSANERRGHSSVLATMGTFFLWFGWYGFNPMSTLQFTGMMGVASHSAITTTISGAASGCIALITHVMFGNHVDIGPALNGILAGLVGITGSCSIVEPYAAFFIGIISGFIYYLWVIGLLKVQIDDPLDATAVHLACGCWGVLAVGLFGTKQRMCDSKYVGCEKDYGLFYGGGFQQLGVQIIGAISIFLWSTITSGILFFTLKKIKILRVAKEDEQQGLDISHHGGSAYHFDHTSIVKKEEAKTNVVNAFAVMPSPQ